MIRYIAMGLCVIPLLSGGCRPRVFSFSNTPHKVCQSFWMDYPAGTPKSKISESLESLLTFNDIRGLSFDDSEAYHLRHIDELKMIELRYPLPNFASHGLEIWMVYFQFDADLRLADIRAEASSIIPNVRRGGSGSLNRGPSGPSK